LIMATLLNDDAEKRRIKDKNSLFKAKKLRLLMLCDGWG